MTNATRTQLNPGKTLGITAAATVLMALALQYPAFVLVAAVLAAAAYQTEYLFYTAVAASPFIFWYIPVAELSLRTLGEYKTFAWPLADVLMAAAGVGVLLRWLWHPKAYRATFPVWKAYVPFLAVALVSAVNAFYPWESVLYALRWVALLYVLYVVTPATIVRDGRVLRRSLQAFIVGGLLVSAMGVASLAQQDVNNDFIRFKPVPIAGVYPIGSNQKQISEVVLVAAMYAVVLARWSQRHSWQRTAYYTLAALFALVAVGSFSRAAWLVLALQLGAVAVLYRTWLRRHWQIVGGAVIVAMAILIPLGTYMVHLQTSDIGYSSNDHRMLLTQIAIEGWRHHPWLGVGSGQYKYLQLKSIRYQATYAPLFESHGVWQKILSENGLAGVAAFIGFMAAIALLWLRQYQTLPATWRREVFVLLVIAAVGIFIFEWFDTNFYKGKMWLPVGMAIAAGWALRTRVSSRIT